MPNKSDLLSLRARIQFAMKEYGYTVYKLASSESERSKLTKQINKDTAISADTLHIILEAFPNLSAEWLLRGEGDFTRSERQGTQLHQHVHTEGGPASVSGLGNASQSCAPISRDKEVELLRDAVAQRDKQIALMQMLIDALRAGQKV